MNYNEVLIGVPTHLKQSTIIQGPGTTGSGKLVLGCGTVKQIGEHAALLGIRKILIITDKTIVSLGLMDEIAHSLRINGIEIRIFDNVPPEPQMETMLSAEEMYRKEPVDAVIGLGGGSCMDVAKLVACLAAADHSADQLMRDSSLITGRIPCILIPTTSGTGSEVSPYVVAVGEGKKLFIASPYLYPILAFVDPLLTITMPPEITAATGLDALSHGVEGVCGIANPYTIGLATQCVEAVFKYLPVAVDQGDNVAARYQMSFASVLGMLTYTQGGGLYSHSASYVITTEKGLTHGLGCGLTLPYTLAYNKSAIEDILERFGSAINRSGFCSVADTTETIEAFLALALKVRIPTTLREIGYAQQDIEGFAQKMVRDYHRPRNPIELSEESAKALIAAMYEGTLM